MANVTAFIGTQWGDEGKGAIGDYLAQQADVVVRATGGNNTGRTVVNEYGKLALHLVPVGIFNPKTVSVIAHGVVVDLKSLFVEIASVEKVGVGVTPGRLLVSPRAHLIMPWHIMTDEAQERKRGKEKIGTTLRGVGPCYTDKIARTGFRVGDILEPDFRDRFFETFESKRKMLRALYGKRTPEHLGSKLWEEFEGYIFQIKPFIADTTGFLWRQLEREDSSILLEGSQGILLDPDFGIDYPFVTSSAVTVAGLSQGSGIAPNKIDKVVGVVKAYTTRVAAGPFPTELAEKDSEHLRELGNEYGATTARPRRCGWLDLNLLNYAIQINGITSLALTKIDILGLLDEIQVAIAYEYSKKAIIHCDDYFSPERLEEARPIYRSFQPWGGNFNAVRSSDDLPQPAQEFVSFIEDSLSIPVEFISFGEERDKLIVR